MSHCILIPIKTINERLPGKNTLLLKGKPLYSYLFNTVKPLNIPVYVDSSDPAILQIAEQWDFNTLVRPEEFNGPDITGDQLLLRNIHSLNYDIISLLHVTNPFLTGKTISTGIDILENNLDIDSVFGVIARYNRFWFNNKPVNHDVNKLIRTQDLTPVYEESDIYFVRKSAFLKFAKRICGKMHQLEVSPVEAIDIDTIIDFITAESFITAGLIS